MEILLVVQVIVVIAMIAVILLQKSGGDGFTGGSSPNSFLTGRASANLFTRITSVLATLFIVNSLVIAYIASHSERASSVLEQAVDEAATENKGKTPEPKKGSLSDIENKMKIIEGKTGQPASADKALPAVPAVPATPSVPVSE
jgi:preprotein translocase subunit SecG